MSAFCRRLGDRLAAAGRGLLVAPVRRPRRVRRADVLAQRGDSLAVGVAQREVEDLEVLLPALVARRLRDGRDVRLVEQPAQRDLPGALAVLLADRGQLRVADDLPVRER